MLHSKLVSLLKALTRKEKSLLSRFVNSPVYNQHKEVIALCNYLLSLPEFTEKNTSKQKLHDHLFPKSKFDDLRLRHVCSYFLQVCETCLGFIEEQKNEDQQQINLLRAYRKHGLQKHFVNDFLLIEKTPPAHSKKSTIYFLNRSQIFHEAQHSNFYDTSLSINFLKQSDSDLTVFFALSKLKKACYFLSFASVNNASKPALIHEVLSFVEQFELGKQALLDCYYCAYRAIEFPEQRPFFLLLKEKILTLAMQIEREELKELLALTILFCEQRIAEGASIFERDLFEIYLTGLTNEAFIDNEILSYSYQKKIVDLGLRLFEYEWVLAFINESKAINEKTLKEDVFLLNTAKLLFAQSNFNACLEKLSLLSDQSFELQIEAKKLIANCYVALQDSKKEKLVNQQLKHLLKKHPGGVPVS